MYVKTSVRRTKTGEVRYLQLAHNEWDAAKGRRAAERFRCDFRAAVGRWGTVDRARVAHLAAEHGVPDLAGLRVAALARPFRGQVFARPSAFRDRLTCLLHADVAAARAGTAASPLKAAMEVLRSLRPALPGIVDSAACSRHPSGTSWTGSHR